MQQSKNQKKKSKSQKSSSPIAHAIDYQHLVQLGGCTGEYAKSLVNPFTGPQACVPTYPVTFSRKFRTFCKGVMSTSSSTGYGFIAADPSYGLTNDFASVFFTGPTFGSTSVDLNIATAGVFTAGSNSEYVTTDIGTADNQVQYKIVSAGLKIRYIGTELNRGGQEIGLQDQNHRSVQGRTLQSIDGEETSKRFQVDRRWKRVLFRPVDYTDLDFQSTLPTFTPAATDPSFYMVWMVQAPSATTSISFEFEYSANYEVYGRNVRGATKSHVDPVGASAVQAVVALGENLHPTDYDSEFLERKMMSDVASYVKETTTQVHVVPTNSADIQALSSKKRKSVKAKQPNESSNTRALIDAGLIIGASLLDWLF